MPDTIFRYIAVNDQKLEHLRQRQIYFASPAQFNDPYDCALATEWISPEVTTEDINAIRDSRYLREIFKTRGTRGFKYAHSDELKELAINTFNNLIAYLNMDRGVACFSECNDNLLMWGHYADSYKGICLEFRSGQAPFEMLHEVNYATSFPVPKLIEILKRRDAQQELMKTVYCTKSRDWSYEKEWRAINESPRITRVFDPSALKAIYLGPRSTADTYEKVRNLLTDGFPEAELWKGKRSSTEFKVEFERIS
jgi:hypothetical protein